MKGKVLCHRCQVCVGVKLVGLLRDKLSLAVNDATTALLGSSFPVMLMSFVVEVNLFVS